MNHTQHSGVLVTPVAATSRHAAERARLSVLSDTLKRRISQFLPEESHLPIDLDDALGERQLLRQMDPAA